MFAGTHQSEFLINAIFSCLIFNIKREMELFFYQVNVIGKYKKFSTRDAIVNGVHRPIEVLLAAYLEVLIPQAEKIASANCDTDRL